MNVFEIFLDKQNRRYLKQILFIAVQWRHIAVSDTQTNQGQDINALLMSIQKYENALVQFNSFYGFIMWPDSD